MTTSLTESVKSEHSILGTLKAKLAEYCVCIALRVFLVAGISNLRENTFEDQWA